MSDLAAVKKALPMFQHMLKEDLVMIRSKCQEKLAASKAKSSQETWKKVIAECDRLTN